MSETSNVVSEFAQSMDVDEDSDEDSGLGKRRLPPDMEQPPAAKRIRK